jgi:hypothetical protein
MPKRSLNWWGNYAQIKRKPFFFQFLWVFARVRVSSVCFGSHSVAKERAREKCRWNNNKKIYIFIYKKHPTGKPLNRKPLRSRRERGGGKISAPTGNSHLPFTHIHTHTIIIVITKMYVFFLYMDTGPWIESTRLDGHVERERGGWWWSAKSAVWLTTYSCVYLISFFSSQSHHH